MSQTITLKDSTFIIPFDKLEKAYQALCRLNWRNDLKSGVRYAPGMVLKPVTDLRPRDDRWFALMPWNYHEIFRNVEEILTVLGFETCYGSENCLFIHGYDGKPGDEEHFIKALAPFATGYMIWEGSDGREYKWEVVNGKLLTYTGVTEWYLDQGQ